MLMTHEEYWAGIVAKTGEEAKRIILDLAKELFGDNFPTMKFQYRGESKSVVHENQKGIEIGSIDGDYIDEPRVIILKPEGLFLYNEDYEPIIETKTEVTLYQYIKNTEAALQALRKTKARRDKGSEQTPQPL